MKKAFVPMLMDYMGLLGLCWILIHLVGIRQHGEVVIYEDNKQLLDFEIIVFIIIVATYLMVKIKR